MTSFLSRRSRYVRASRFALLALLLGTLTTPELRSQTLDSDYREGTESFRYLIKNQGFTHLNSLNDLRDPEGKVLIVLGDTKPLERLPGGIIGFLRGGGAILIATDYPVHSGPLANQLRVRVSGEMAKCPDESPNATYLGLEDCPIVQAEPDDQTGLLKDLRRGLATNKPSYLEPPRLNLTLHVLGYLPVNCVFGDDRHTLRNQGKGQVFGLAGSILSGRILILADHSIFINQMIQQIDNDNGEFARRSIKWLRGENGERSEVLFYENGQIKTLDVKKSELKKLAGLPPGMKLDLAQAVNQFLANAEEENLFDAILMSFIPRYWDHATFRILLFSLLFLAFALVSVGFARYRRAPGVPFLSKAVAQAEPGTAIVEQRTLALLKSGNWSEAARALAQRFFEEAGVSGDKLPATQFNGSFYHNWKGRRRLQALWRLAHGKSPQRFTPRRYQDLQKQVRHLKGALANGSLAFGSVNSPGVVTRPSGERVRSAV